MWITEMNAKCSPRMTAAQDDRIREVLKVKGFPFTDLYIPSRDTFADELPGGLFLDVKEGVIIPKDDWIESHRNAHGSRPWARGVVSFRGRLPKGIHRKMDELRAILGTVLKQRGAY